MILCISLDDSVYLACFGMILYGRSHTATRPVLWSLHCIDVCVALVIVVLGSTVMASNNQLIMNSAIDNICSFCSVIEIVEFQGVGVKQVFNYYHVSANVIHLYHLRYTSNSHNV